MITDTSERDAHEREGGISPFALDVFWASGCTGDPPLEAHVAACDRCRAYLAGLDALGAGAAPAVAVRELPRARRARWALPTAALALAAGVALVAGGALRAPTTEGEGYVGVKGTPAVQLLVHRGQSTRVWDGRSPVHPGDALALRVACEGLTRVTVAAPDTSGWEKLSGAACPSAEEPLPFTLLVNGDPGDEKLAVVLTRGEIDEGALGKAIAESRRSADTWVVTYILPKETGANR